MAEVGETLLQMQGDGIVNLGAHACGREVLPQQVTVANPDYILVIDVSATGLCWRLHRAPQVSTREGIIVEGRVTLPPVGPGIQMLELDVEDGRLQLIEAEI